MKEKILWDWMQSQVDLWAKLGCQEAADALQALIDKEAGPHEDYWLITKKGEYTLSPYASMSEEYISHLATSRECSIRHIRIIPDD